MNFFALSEKIEKRGIKKTAIAKQLGISEKALSNKLSGKTSFSWEQACLIQSLFFPDCSKDELFLVK